MTMPDGGPLRWRHTHHTENRSVWAAGDYELRGIGRRYGGGIRRDWSLRYRGREIGTPSRLSEGKRDAEYHRRAQAAHPGS